MSREVKLLYPGKFLSLAAKDDWEFVIRRHPVVVLIAWTPDDELLLVEQYRIPVGRRTIELPAGLVGDDQDLEHESLLQAARRELEEETGWRAGKLRKLICCPTSAGMTDEQVAFIEATELVRTGPGGGAGSEDITVHRVHRRDIDDWLARNHAGGLALDPKIYTALYWSGLHGKPPSQGG